MKAEIIAVGTELLMGEILNSNSRDIARELYNLDRCLSSICCRGQSKQSIKRT